MTVANQIAIMAGNPKVEMVGDKVVLDSQLPAFEMAMKLVKECRERVAKIAIVFDHPGIFREKFFDESVQFPSNKAKYRAKKHLKLCLVHREIRKVYEPVAEDYGVSLEEISVYSKDIIRAVIEQQTPHHKVNCRRVGASIIEKLSKYGDEIHTYWVYDGGRVQTAVISDGTEFAYTTLGVEKPVKQNIIYPLPDGRKYVVTTDFIQLKEKEVKIETGPKRFF